MHGLRHVLNVDALILGFIMIDYDKLKLAMNLAEKYYNETGEMGVIELNFSFACHTYLHKLWINSVAHNCSDIDEIITKLQSLLKPETKYKLSDDVWFMHDGLLMCGIVDRINFYNECVIYHVSAIDDGFTMGEGLLFSTRQALIEHQIKYWSNMQARDFEDEIVTENSCDHEYDSFFYNKESVLQMWSSGRKVRCIKCEDFYR